MRGTFTEPASRRRVGEQSNPKVQEELRQRSEARNGDAGSRQSTPHGHENGAFLPDVEAPGETATSTARDLHPTLANVGRFSTGTEVVSHWS